MRASRASEHRTRAPSGQLRTGFHERGYLPHLKEEGGSYFVTFRLADTLPEEVVARIDYERAMAARSTESGTSSLASDRFEVLDAKLEAGYGACWLEDVRIGGMVASALRYFADERYRLSAWVVMPNHVHVVVTPMESWTLSDILHSWKSFTAHEVQRIAKANRLPVPSGQAFWQRESYDHLVRDDNDLARVVDYTIQNPVRAGLCNDVRGWRLSSAHADAS